VARYAPKLSDRDNKGEKEEDTPGGFGKGQGEGICPQLSGRGPSSKSIKRQKKNSPVEKKGTPTVI